MFLGMPTLIEKSDVKDCVKLCESLGLDFIELNMNLPEYQPDRIDVEKLVDVAKKKAGKSIQYIWTKILILAISTLTFLKHISVR